MDSKQTVDEKWKEKEKEKRAEEGRVKVGG